LTRRLIDEWDELADATAAGPFRRSGWIQAWWMAFGRGKLETLAVRENGYLTAVLPLRSRFGELTAPSNWHTPDFGPIAEDERSLNQLVEGLFVRRPRRVSLASLDSETRILALCRQLASRHGYRVLVRTIQRPPYLAIDKPWAEYERGLSRNVRGDATRRIRRLEEVGTLSLDVRDGTERLDELLTEGFRIEASGWKGSRGTAISSKTDTDRFYREVARWAADRGWLRLAFLRLDDIPIAFHYSLEEAGIHYFLKGGHDSHYERFSPGKVLTYQMLSRAFSIGLARYEFLGTDDSWKLNWTNRCRERKLFHAFRASPDGLLEWTIFNYGRRAAKNIVHVGRLNRLRR
jgi:CelD/BcsL family acetyltransferase involved in cellulose biosynthesis